MIASNTRIADIKITTNPKTGAIMMLPVVPLTTNKALVLFSTMKSCAAKVVRDKNIENTINADIEIKFLFFIFERKF